MSKLRDQLDAAIKQTTLTEFKQSILDTCSYITEDGLDVSDLKQAAETVTDDTEPLSRALDKYYSKPEDGKFARVLPQYEKFADYLSCICSTIRDIKKKKQFIADGLCSE